MKVICYMLDSECIGYADMSVRPEVVHWKKGYENSNTTESLIFEYKQSDPESLFGLSSSTIRKLFRNVKPIPFIFECGYKDKRKK